MFHQQGSILRLLILFAIVPLTIAAPPHFPELDDYKYNPRPKTKAPVQRPRGINWKHLRPALGAVGILALLAGAVFVGTKLDQSHLRRLEAHKREKYQKIVDSGVWMSGRELPASINGEEAERMKKVGFEERVELAMEETRHRLRVGKLKQEIIVKYFEELGRIQGAHAKDRGAEVVDEVES
jgi:hypothetical protein